MRNDQDCRTNHSLLADIAHQAMIDRGLEPDFPPAVDHQLDGIGEPAKAPGDIRDLRKLLWCSIDNDDSRDLDQLTVAEDLGGGKTRILVAVADVDALVDKGTPIDEHAHHNTTSVYTAARIFPMLPEKLSTNLTSLNEHEERVAMVMDMQVGSDGSVVEATVYRALVYNQAQLAYNAVGAWLEGQAPPPDKVGGVKGLAENLKLQDKIADSMRDLRHEHGALDLETIEPRAVFSDGRVVDLMAEARNNAKNLIEDFMIAANGVTARFLESKKFSSIRRVVRSPERWDRIEAIAADLGDRLPMPKRWKSSSSGGARRTRCASPISRSPSSRPWAPASTCSSAQVRPLSVTSDWPCATTRTRPRPTAVIPTSSPIAC